MVPPPAIHQPSDAEPSPPTLSLPMNVAGLHGWPVNRYFTESFMPFSAASVTAWVQEVPAVMAMNTSGFFEASVVIGSLMVGADGSIVSGSYSILSLTGDWARKPLNPTS